MSVLYSPQLQDRKKESLQTHYEFLNLLRRRHLHWMSLADDPEVAQIHLEIAGVIQEMTDQYHSLIDSLQKQTHEELSDGV